MNLIQLLRFLPISLLTIFAKNAYAENETPSSKTNVTINAVGGTQLRYYSIFPDDRHMIAAVAYQCEEPYFVDEELVDIKKDDKLVFNGRIIKQQIDWLNENTDETFTLSVFSSRYEEGSGGNRALWASSFISSDPVEIDGQYIFTITESKTEEKIKGVPHIVIGWRIDEGGLTVKRELRDYEITFTPLEDYPMTDLPTTSKAKVLGEPALLKKGSNEPIGDVDLPETHVVNYPVPIKSETPQGNRLLLTLNESKDHPGLIILRSGDLNNWNEVNQFIVATPEESLSILEVDLSGDTPIFVKATKSEEEPVQYRNSTFTDYGEGPN